MALNSTACTACSCLCDDIGLQIEGNTVKRIENACRKGSAFIYATQSESKRNMCLVEGQPVDADKALDRAAKELSRAKRPLIFGLDNSSLEAQSVGIELARRLGCVIDDTSSYCQGNLVEHVLDGTIPTCSLEDVKSSDLILYWGSNPHHSHPRHLSKFTIYAHPEYVELGATRRVTLAAIEVRESETAVICHRVFRVKPRGDRDLIDALSKGITTPPTTPDAQRILDLLRKSRFITIFVGLGLTYSLDNDYASFVELCSRLSKWGRLAIVPMVGHYNMRGFNQSLRKATGFVNKVSFAGGLFHGDQYSLLEQVRTCSTDCVLVVGSDPFSSLPKSVKESLVKTPRIVVDPFQSSTSKEATVVIGPSVTGIESGGSAVRMDGTEVKLTAALKTNRLSDELILTRIADRLSR